MKDAKKIRKETFRKLGQREGFAPVCNCCGRKMHRGHVVAQAVLIAIVMNGGASTRREIVEGVVELMSKMPGNGWKWECPKDNERRGRKEKEKAAKVRQALGIG